jgi:hypothetical protein
MPWDLNNDLINGKIRERIAACHINTHIYPDDPVKLFENQTEQVDFRNSEIIGEVKSRDFKHFTFEETFFGYNKIKFLKEEKQRMEDLTNDIDDTVWKFYFLFTDGLWVWSYNEDQFEVRDFDHRERGKIDQAYVNIKYLEKLTALVTYNSKLPSNWKDLIN